MPNPNFRGIKTTKNRGYSLDNISQIYQTMKDWGLNDYQVSSLLGSIIEESGGNPMNVSSKGTYQGLLQWGSDRYRIKSQDPNKELQNQLNYIKSTLSNTKDHVSWTDGGKGSGYKSLKDAYNAFNNPSSSIDDVMRGLSLGYVRPAGGINSYNNRLGVVKQVQQRIAADSLLQNDDVPTYIAQPDALRVTRPLVPPVVPAMTKVPIISTTPNVHAEGGMLYGNEEDMPSTPQEEYQANQETPQESPKQWDELSLSEKNAFIASAVKHGITNMEDIRNAYNELIQEQANVSETPEEEGNKFLKGGYKPSKSIMNYIANKEGASMKTNRSFEAEAHDFWRALPEDVRGKLTQQQADALYSYSYNVGAGNFKHRVVPALQRYFSGNGSMEDVQRHMYATKDSQLRGLAKRRAEERAMFAGSKVPVYDVPVHEDTPYVDTSSTWRSSKLGLASPINMSKGLGIVDNNAMRSNNLLGPVSNNQGNGMMKEAINVFSDNDSQSTFFDAPQEEQSSLDRYNAIQDYLAALGSFGFSRGGRMYDEGGVVSSNGQYHVSPSEYSGVLSNVSNDTPLEVTLPDTTVIANDPRNYRSYYDPNGTGEFLDATTLGLFPNPFNLSRSASTFMQNPSLESAWDTTKDALMFAGGTGKEAAFAPLGIMNLVDKDGVRKTYGLIKDGNYAGAAMSGLGDALNAGMARNAASPLLTNVKDYNNIKKFIERYGYNEYKPKIGLIFDGDKMDKLTKRLVQQHNRFTRGVSVSEARKYYGFPKEWSDEQIAEYCLTHPHIPRAHNSGGNPERNPVLYTSNSLDLSKQYTDGNGYIGILQRPITYDPDRSKMLEINDFRFKRLPGEVNNNFNPSVTTDEPYIFNRRIPKETRKHNKIKGGLAGKYRGRVIRRYTPVSPTFLDAQANAGSYIFPTQLPYDPNFRHYLFYGEPEEELLGLEKLIKYTKPEGTPSVDYKPYSIGFSKKKALGGKL